jgi:hypothetical protein
MPKRSATTNATSASSCAIGINQPIIAEARHVVGTDAQHLASEAVHALLLTANRLAFDDDRRRRS